MITSGVQDTPWLFINNLNAGLNTTKLSKLSVVINESLNLIYCLSFVNEQTIAFSRHFNTQPQGLSFQHNYASKFHNGINALIK